MCYFTVSLTYVFFLSVPLDLDVRVKAVLLGAVFAIVSKFRYNSGYQIMEQRVKYRPTSSFLVCKHTVTELMKVKKYKCLYY